MSKGNKYLLIVGVLVVGLVVYLTLRSKTNKSAITAVLPSPTSTAIAVVSPSPRATANGTIYRQIKMTDGLIIQDLVLGTGAEAVAGKKITVNYSGTLTNGTKFDSSYDRGVPFSFNLGAGEVIKGWDEGFAGMKVGGKRKLTIPSELGYGAQDMGAIPPNSTLVFEVELISVN